MDLVLVMDAITMNKVLFSQKFTVSWPAGRQACVMFPHDDSAEDKYTFHKWVHDPEYGFCALLEDEEGAMSLVGFQFVFHSFRVW